MENLNDGIEKFKVPTTASDFAAGETELKHIDEKGKIFVYVLLSNGSVATVKEGKGSDVERATMEANGNQSKYLTAMMAATITIDGKGCNMFQLADEKMKDYMKLQIVFSDINF